MNIVKIDSIEILWYGHASFRLTDGDRYIYFDPFVLPENVDRKADVILVTHEHFDHCHVGNIKTLEKQGTKIIGSHGAIKKIGHGQYVSAGVNIDMPRLSIKSVEAYNVNKFRQPGQQFHPKGLGVGFVVELVKKRIYHAGDTDKISEMSNIDSIDVALLPIGGTYTMTVQEAAEAALLIRPKAAVPMHYNSDKYGVTGINSDPLDLAKLLVGKGVMVHVLDPAV